eukprot:11186899-Karenia_brevis.AAC.1
MSLRVIKECLGSDTASGLFFSTMIWAPKVEFHARGGSSTMTNPHMPLTPATPIGISAMAT